MADIDNRDNNENIELEEITQIEESETDEAGTEEANLGGTDDLTQDESNQSIFVPQGFSPDLGEAPEGPSSFMKRIFTRDRKIFLKNALNVSLNKGDGPNSTTLFDNLQLTNDQRTGNNNGAKYKGVKIIVVKDGEYTFSTSADKKTRNAITDFKATLEKAKAEHAKTAVGETEKQFEDVGVENLSQEDVYSVLSDVEERLSDRRTKQLTGVVEVMELKADMLRIRNDIKPETGLVKKLIKTEAKIGDISRLKRFTNWAKENLLGLSAVAVSVAGIITTVVIAGRAAVRFGARATKSLRVVSQKSPKKSQLCWELCLTS